VGAHPNTVRLYETWGFLPPIPRSPSGYRLYTQAHLDQMRLARLAMHGDWPGRNIRQSALALVRQAASGDLGGALEQAYHHLALVRAEQAQAQTAADYVEHWADGTLAEAAGQALRIGEAAKLLDLTIDTLRSWERNGLIKVPRDPHSGYRQYGAEETGRLRVVRTLLRSGYSTSAILRLLLSLDAERPADLRAVLDTPRPDEDIYSAADRWLSSLAEQEQRARRIVAQLRAMIRKHA